MRLTHLHHMLLGIAILLLAAAIVCAGAPQKLGEYLQRQAAAKADDAAAQFELAQWAQREGLQAQAMEGYRRVLELEPDHDEAYEQLTTLAVEARLDDEPEVCRQLQQEFGDGFSIHVSPHFIVVYNTDKAWALDRAVLLEKTYDVYFKNLQRAKLKPLPLASRLICVLFQKHQEFMDYAQRVDRVTLPWSSGYYSSRSNRIAFFNEEDSPQFQEVRQEMAKLVKQIADLDAQIEEANRRKNLAIVLELRQQKSQFRDRLRWFENRHNAVAGLGNAAKTTHEAVHQLAFNTGLQVRSVVYPFWITEGLATNFEADNGAQEFGPFHDNPSRRATLKEARDEKKLTPLAELVSIAGPSGDDPQQVSHQYAEVWGLYTYLFRRHHEQMQTYLRSLAKLPKGEREAAAMLAEFEKAFGPVAEVDKGWQRYLKQLR